MINFSITYFSAPDKLYTIFRVSECVQYTFCYADNSMTSGGCAFLYFIFLLYFRRVSHMTETLFFPRPTEISLVT